MPYEPVVKVAASVKATRVRWLWPKYVARGQVTILDGDPGTGKSFITMDLAARVSRGDVMPGGRYKGDPEPVLVCNAEDDEGTTIVPRLRALGADLDRVRLLSSIRHEGKEEALLLPNAYDTLEMVICQFKPALIIIDPVMAFLSPEVRTFQDQSVRLALEPLKRLAREHDAAILVVRHLNKNTAAKAIYRGGGSIGLVGLCRSGLLVGENPDNPGERLLTQIKNNLAKRQPSLAYEIEFADGAPRVAWLGVREVSADQALVHNIGRTPLANACELIRNYLGDNVMKAKEVALFAMKNGVSAATVARAHDKIPVISTKINKCWYWSLRAPTEEQKNAITLTQ